MASCTDRHGHLIMILKINVNLCHVICGLLCYSDIQKITLYRYNLDDLDNGFMPLMTSISLQSCLKTIAMVMMLIFGAASAWAQDTSAPVDFTANAVSSNAETGVMTAEGDVVITQGKMRLLADRVDYNRNEGKAVATGNVIFTDNDGSTHYTDMLVLEKNFSKAIAEPVISQFKDGSWVGGDKVNHDRALGTVYEKARYTPCDCDFIGGKTPAWEINSSQSRHDPNSQTIYHENVTMKIFAVPVLYFPYLDHPDWTVRRRSGLLPPRISFSSDLGTTYAQSYYWVTGETHDAEITPYYFGNQGAAVKTTYRQRWDYSSLNATIYKGRLNTYKKSREDVAGIDAVFKTTLGQKWKTDVRLYRASQDTFMRRYNFDDAQTLKSSIRTERIDRNAYSRVEAYDIQDLTSDRDEENEATVLPSVFHERYLDTDQEGLSLRVRLSALQLDNDESTDLKRWTSELYSRQDITTDFGQLSVEGRLAGQYRNIETATNNSGYEGELGQTTVAAGVGWAMPVSVQMADRFAIVEPKVKLVSVKATDRSNSIPNRDSSDFRLDEANLFLLHREQGEDYNITSTRIDGGVSMSLYDPYLGDVTGFVGSSIRLAGETPTGLNSVAETDRISDILASLTVQPYSNFSMAMSGRFHPRDFHLNETKLSGQLSFAETQLSASYNQLSKSYFDSATEEKEELVVTAKQNLGYGWGLSVTQKYDMTNDKRELTDSIVDINYGGGLQDCLNISIGYNRDTDSDRDIKPIDEVFVVFNFKNLGAVGTNQVKSLSSN